MIEPAELERKLRDAFPSASTIEVKDLTGTKDHFQAVIVTPDFAGKSRVEQHRMVYGALGELMRAAVHALALETRAK